MCDRCDDMEDRDEQKFRDEQEVIHQMYVDRGNPYAFVKDDEVDVTEALFDGDETIPMHEFLARVNSLM